MKKILVIGPAWVGDMVMAQSLFKLIKSSEGENTIIDVLAPNWSSPLLERMPEVRTAHTMSIGHGILALKQRYQIAQKLKSEAYNQAIVLPNSWKSALIPWWAKIPQRTGFLGEWRLGLLNDIRHLNKQALPRMIDRYAELGYHDKTSVKRTTPYPHLSVNPASLAATLTKFGLVIETGSKPKPILALCPGAEFGASKRWPESYYAEVAKAKHTEGWDVWLFGSKNDDPTAMRIHKETGGKCLNFTGKTTLAEAIDLLSLATLVVTNDSGLMHIAAALQKPLIAIYGSTDPNYTPPLGDTSKIVRLDLPCSPCFKRECPLKHHDCMQKLYPQNVLTKIKAMSL